MSNEPVRCPRCQVETIPYPVARGSAGHCPNCEGILADRAALASISGSVVVAKVFAMAQDESIADLACSGCGDPMRTWKTKGVVVDICPSDEFVWLDAGEMARFRPGLRDQSELHSSNVVRLPPRFAMVDAIFDLFD